MASPHFVDFIDVLYWYHKVHQVANILLKCTLVNGPRNAFFNPVGHCKNLSVQNVLAIKDLNGDHPLIRRFTNPKVYQFEDPLDRESSSPK